MSGNTWRYVKYGLLYKYKEKNKGTGGTCDARYCYSVWMRHFINYYEIKQNIPKTVAEFGPGDTIGIGLTALLCGAENYYALDFMQYTGMKRIGAVFEQLVSLLENKSDIPDDSEYPGVYPKLKSYAFPDYILTDEQLQYSLSPSRIQEIRNAVNMLKGGKNSARIQYLAPWWKEDVGSIRCDLIFSQAVFEHIDDYEKAHKVIGQMLKKGAVVSHQIDFSCHGCADKWNGQWAYGKLMWRLVYGSRPYFLNRVPCSVHIKEMQKAAIKIIRVIRFKGKNGICKESLCRECRYINKKDLETRGAFILGVKNEN